MATKPLPEPCLSALLHNPDGLMALGMKLRSMMLQEFFSSALQRVKAIWKK